MIRHRFRRISLFTWGWQGFRWIIGRQRPTGEPVARPDLTEPRIGSTDMRAVHSRTLREPKVSIVVPARNEARNLEVVLPMLPAEAEIIVVDGHSVDGSAEVVARVRPDARFVQQTRRGKGNALVVG